MRLQSMELRDMQIKCSHLMQSTCDLREVRRWCVDYVIQAFGFSMSLSTKIEALAYNLLCESLSTGHYVIVTVDTLRDSHNLQLYCGVMTETSVLIKFAIGDVQNIQNTVECKEDSSMYNVGNPVGEVFNQCSTELMQSPQLSMGNFEGMAQGMMQMLNSTGFGGLLAGDSIGKLGMKQVNNESITQTAEVTFNGGVPTFKLSSTRTNTLKTSSLASTSDSDVDKSTSDSPKIVNPVSSRELATKPGMSSIELALASAERAKQLASQACRAIRHETEQKKTQSVTRSFTLSRDGTPVGGTIRQINRDVTRQDTHFNVNGTNFTVSRFHTVSDKSEMKAHGGY